MSQVLSDKYFKDNKEKLQKTCKRYQSQKKPAI